VDGAGVQRRGDALLSRLSRRTTGGRWIPEIDGLRFVAIALVLADHAAVALSLATHANVVEAPFGSASEPARLAPMAAILRRGSVGVLVFFLVSGFVLALPFVRSRASGGHPVDLGRYLGRRVTRIEPPYLITMTVLFVAASLAGSSVGLGHYVASLGYLHGAYFGTDSPLNGVAWSLEIEVQFYVVVPALALLVCAGGRILRRSRIILMAAFAIVSQMFGFLTAHTFLGSSIQFFLLGWLLADLYVTDWAEAPRPARMWDLVGFATVPLLLVGLATVPPPVEHVLTPWLVFALGYSALRSISLRRVLSNRWIATIGGMCYSIYLVHYALFVTVQRFLGPVGRLPSSVAPVVSLLVLVPLAVVVGAVFFVLVERPCMDPHWLDRAIGRIRAAGAPRPRPDDGLTVVISDSGVVSGEPVPAR
jgi:peptidoglycan/LPS O-acetylase OafA/YrhL